MGHEGFSIIDMIPLLNQIPSHIAYAIIVIVFLMIISILATRSIRKETKKHFIPEGRLTARTAGEVIAESLLKIVKENMGPRGPEFMMIIGTLALFILVSNVLGMIPGFQSPTANINTTGACALTVFCLTHYYGIREHGIKYLKQFTGPLIVLAPLMIPIELIGHFVRPVSLSIRLFGNIFGDHTVVFIFMGLVAIPVLYPLPMMLLGLLVAIIQTFVFILLSMTYFSLAIEGHEH
jgi:F-type H+-transporting ATPase subunit a